ncbi:two-component sensor histidine kinase, partial [Burkholderia sp. 4701]|nr:two-component sensor histidine kinase [Burkholderia sp. 4701]MXN87405.1 two-component sensor histidine kinase [Burkholderia sp. 4812]
FRRANDTRRGQNRGSGLGLAVVAAIAHAHGGQALCIPSGSGTCFELRWPADLAPTPHADRRAGTRPAVERAAIPADGNGADDRA